MELMGEIAMVQDSLELEGKNGLKDVGIVGYNQHNNSH